MNTQLTVETIVNTDVVKAWDFFTLPEHVMQWNFAAPEWHCPQAENDLQVGGKFSYRMEAKDGSFGFDFWGVYDVVNIHRYIKYTLGDNRTVEITFSAEGEITKVTEVFEAETENPLDMQQMGWHLILNNYKAHAENGL
ncbi:MAG: SRPBCC domain-containing protein [Chitinophagales bacterium]|nr:SRPBCC domain-containing protein [Chitinophagales bacterium]